MSTEFSGATVLPRPRVDALLACAWTHRVSVISAGAGYGKSTALAARFGGPGRVVLLPIRPNDRDVAVLSSRIARAIGIDGAAITPDSVAGVDDRGAMAEARVATLCEAIPAVSETLLILDDVDVIAGDPDATAFVRSLCLQAPPQMHVALSGRDVQRAGIWADARGGEVLEIGANDLAFTRDEVHALLALTAGTSQDDQVVLRCWTLTNGWPAAVRLVAEAVTYSSDERGLPALSGSGPWRRFARRVVDSEPDEVRDALDVLSVVGTAGPDLLNAVGGPRNNVALADLAERGLLVVEQNPPGFRLSPVLDRVVRDRLAPDRAARIAMRAAAWLEESARYGEALDLYAAGESPAVRGFLARHGHHLVTSGAGRRVSEVLGAVGSGGDAVLDAVYAQSLWTSGDWEGAVEWFGKAERSYGGRPLPSSVAWRFGALLYLRGDTERATSVLARRPPADLLSGDDALCLAWLASAQWSRGQIDEAEASAEQASAIARATGDARALAAAHVGSALVAAARGDREANDRHYRAGIAAARSVGDTVQATRIYANLASRALEEGRYTQAVEHADAALDLGAGHRFFTGLALSNKAEALLRMGRLDDARACAAESVEAYAACGSLLECGPHLILGEVHRQRGDAVHARLAAERAARLGYKADDLQALVKAWAALAWILAIDDPVGAGRFADQAVGRATSLGRADALNAAAWVRLCAGQVAQAVTFANEGEAEARRTDDRPNLAAALELRAAADRGQRPALTEAIALWAEIGDPLALARARLSAGLLDGEPRAIEAARAELIQHGAAVDVGLPRYLDRVYRDAPAADAAWPAITTLGRFSLIVDGEPVPTSAWQSRKARDLLKLLAARRGKPITRDAAAEALWPEDEPDLLANRLSVALSVVRRVLDPQRRHAADHFVVADGRSVALRVDRVRLDVAEFFEALHEAEASRRHGAIRVAEAALRRASELYSGDFLEEDRFEDWAIDCREQAHSAALTVARQLARAADQRGSDEEAAAYLMRLLERDPYDEAAWAALLGAQVRLRRHGEARRTYARYLRRMGELEIEPMAFEEAARSRP
jgi:DNA-binding SARP family transcriptional activator/tetratricopeptide (TPR) repeat protein